MNLAIIVFVFFLFFSWILYKKNMHIWLPSYVFSIQKKSKSFHTHIMFCVANHFEPAWGKVDFEQQKKRVTDWCDNYLKTMSSFRDADGHFPKQTYFYPEEEYHPELLNLLSEHCKKSGDEVEVHLHHDNDSEDAFLNRVQIFLQRLNRHGLAHFNKNTSEQVFGFVHGNWALDNSRKDGRWCGLNNELKLLRKLGCYADFTLPSAPSDTQTHKINSIYYAKDDPQRPKSHNTGLDVEINGMEMGDLMLIQGPLGLQWNNRKFGLLPRIENADISASQPPSQLRVDSWINHRIQVKGKEDWVFVKIHTHGLQEKNQNVWSRKSVSEMYEYLINKYNDKNNFTLHFVTAREMYNIIKAAEAGKDGNPNLFRDYLIC